MWNVWTWRTMKTQAACVLQLSVAVCSITTYGTGWERLLLRATAGCANHVRRLTILSFPLAVLFVAAKKTIKPFIINTFSNQVEGKSLTRFNAPHSMQAVSLRKRYWLFRSEFLSRLRWMKGFILNSRSQQLGAFQRYKNHKHGEESFH